MPEGEMSYTRCSLGCLNLCITCILFRKIVEMREAASDRFSASFTAGTPAGGIRTGPPEHIPPYISPAGHFPCRISTAFLRAVGHFCFPPPPPADL